MVDDKEGFSMRNAIRKSQDTHTQSGIDGGEDLEPYSKDPTWGVTVMP